MSIFLLCMQVTFKTYFLSVLFMYKRYKYTSVCLDKYSLDYFPKVYVEVHVHKQVNTGLTISSNFYAT